MNAPVKHPDLVELKRMLAAAIQLEHATIPPYLTALYSIHAETNIEATQVIRAVLVEEMLHMTLSANLLNAIGGHPNLLDDQFMPNYPALLPDGEKDFEVSIAKFDQENLEIFLQIERPSKKNLDKQDPFLPKGCFKKKNIRLDALAATFIEIEGEKYGFYSIGDFYDAILGAMIILETEAQAKGESIFIKNSSLQIDPQYYYSGGGKIIKVMDLETAIKAIRLIQDQGEGYDKGVFDENGEISHFYRFQQLKLGQFYHLGDEPGKPTGEKFEVDWNAVYPMVKNPKVEMFGHDSELYAAAKKFNVRYRGILTVVNNAYNGEPDLLLNEVPNMFRIKEYATSLMRNPIPGNQQFFGGPTFETNTIKVKTR